MARVTVEKVKDFTIHPWMSTSLEVNGVQYEGISNASTSNTYVSVNARPFNVVKDPIYPGGRGHFEYVEFGLTAAFQGNAITLLNYKWRARNLVPVTTTWVDIRPDELVNAVTTSWQDQTVSGRIKAANDFNSVPFEVELQFRTNVADVVIAFTSSSGLISTQVDVTGTRFLARHL